MSKMSHPSWRRRGSTRVDDRADPAGGAREVAATLELQDGGREPDIDRLGAVYVARVTTGPGSERPIVPEQRA
jgi:hypothetical protein